MAKPSDELVFSIKNDGVDFFTGHCADGRQLVMGLLCPELVTVLFDAEGNYLCSEERPWSAAAAKVAGHKPPYDICNEPFQKLIAAELTEWQNELGYRPGTIRVKTFWADNHHVGIDQLPYHYRDLETADWIPNEEERREMMASRDRWLADGDFVFWWAKDYFMSKEGDVTST